MLTALYLACSSAVLCWATLFGLRRYLISRSVLDLPNQRSSHRQPVPRGGGLAILSLVVIAILGAAVIFRDSVTRASLLCYLCGALLVGGISWLDDLRPRPVLLRMGVQCAAGALVIAALLPLSTVELPILGEVSLGALAWPLSLLWIVGLTNSFNFMDGIDGIAGGQALVAALGWVYFGLRWDCPALYVPAAVLVGCSMAFLQHNWHPARIFMGDVGSAFLGYSFAALAIIAATIVGRIQVPPGKILWVSAFLVWPFIFDTGFTFLRRLVNRENVFSAHRSHLYQRLVIAGWRHDHAALLYVGLSIVGLCGSVATLSPNLGFWPQAAIAALALGLWGLVLVVERRAELRKSEALEPQARL